MNKKTASYVMLFLCNLFWAGNYVAGKGLSGLIDPVWITYIRWLAASVILVGIAWLIEKPTLTSIRKNAGSLVLMGLFGVMGYNTILYTALNHTSSLNASIINSMNPGLLVILSAFFLKERLTLPKGIGILISLVGAVVVISHGDFALLRNMSFNVGDLLMLLAILVWSLYSIVSKRLTGIRPITATAFSGLFAVLMLTPMVLYVGHPPTVWTAKMVWSILYIIAFPSIGSFLFWNFSLRNIEAGKAGISMNLVPVFIALISWAMGIAITPFQLIGGLIVIFGVLITSGLIPLGRKARIGR